MQQNKQQGKIYLILGPMFSGKTTELMRQIQRFRFVNKKCLLINHTYDNRYSNDNYIVTHNQQKLECLKISHIKEIIDNDIYKQYDIIGIDEGQFFQDIDKYIDKMIQYNEQIIISGLDSDYNRQMFQPIIKLIPLADKYDKLTSICVKCYGTAIFTQIKQHNNDQNNNIKIGSNDIYEPVCRQCFK